MSTISKSDIIEIIDNAKLNKEDGYTYGTNDYEWIEYSEEGDCYYYHYDGYIYELDEEASEYYFTKYGKHTLDLISMEIE